MELVLLSGKSGRGVWVNPARVLTVRADGQQGSRITFDHETFALVWEAPGSVAAALMGLKGANARAFVEEAAEVPAGLHPGPHPGVGPFSAEAQAGAP